MGFFVRPSKMFTVFITVEGINSVPWLDSSSLLKSQKPL